MQGELRIGRRVLVLAGTVAALTATTVAAAHAAPGATRGVDYLGHHFQVPGSWDVVNLADHPSTCVRFDRHVVYLGTPGADQNCPDHVVGRTEALLVQPSSSAPADWGTVRNAIENQFVARANGIQVTGTYHADPKLIQSILAAAALPTGGPQRPAATPKVAAPLVDTGSTSFTGQGFDACAAPSSGAMGAWRANSPYAAVGIYVGGGERACAQPNLTAGWVQQQASAGWHFLPIYVGPQASETGSANGTAAADDAVNQATSLGFGPGTPVYYDMEAYDSSVYKGSVLNFLAAWTRELHARGFDSGVYSSALSGITDLVSQAGTGYPEPDVLYNARYNGVASTDDPAIPAGDWFFHQRVHQFNGGHNETYGGVTINIDNDYLDVASGSPTPAAWPLYNEFRDGTGNWSGFQPLQGFDGATTFAASRVATAGFTDGSTQVIAIGDDGNLYHDIRFGTPGNPWQGWGPTQGVGDSTFFNARSVAVAAINTTDTHNGELHVSAIGNDGNLYYDIRFTNGDWQGWDPMPGAEGAPSFGASDVAMTGMPDGSVQVIAIGNDSDIWHNIRHPDGSWQGWNPVTGFQGGPTSTFSARGLAIAGFTDGSAQLVAIGDDGNLYHDIRFADGSWQGWGQMQGNAGSATFNGSAVTIAAVNDKGDPTDGQLQVAAIGLDGRVYHDIRFADGNWQGWAGVLGPNGSDHISGTAIALTGMPGTPTTEIIANDDGQ